MMNLWDEGKDLFVTQLRTNRISEEVIQDFLTDQSTCEEARKSAVAIRGDAGQKYGNVNKWLNKIIDNMDRFVAVGNYAMQGAPETVGMAWFAVKTVLTAVHNNKKLYDFFGSSLAEITDLMVLISTYDELYDKRDKKADWKATDIVTQLFAKIRSVYAAILDYSFSVKKHTSTNRKRDRILHAFGDAFGANQPEFEGKMTSIKALKISILEDSQGAFQQGAFEGLDQISGQINNVQSTMNTVLASIQEAAETSLQNDKETKQLLQEALRLTRPKSHFELAMQIFRQNEKTLNPLPDSESLYSSYLEREEGTCSWLLDLPEYVAWRDSSVSSILCLRGEKGCGKSTVAAFVVQSLISQLAGNPDYSVLYYFYDDKYADDSNATQALVRLENTLIHHLYKTCADDESKPFLLQQANEAFAAKKQMDKAKDSGKSASQSQSTRPKQDASNSISDIYEIIVQLLKKKVYLVVDGIDGVNHPSLFVEHLQELVLKSSIEVHVLVTSSQNRDLSNCLYNAKAPQITIGQNQNNISDVEVIVRKGLGKIPGLSQTERDLAFEKVVEKTAGIVNYAVQIALPFLEQPFQRPLSNHLSRLPENMNETYAQHVRQLAPNYVDLLRTALTWTLLGESEVRLYEIMDAYSGVYLQNEGDESDHGDGSVDGNDAVYITQIRAAGGPFLDISTSETNPVVTTTDYRSILDFCFESSHDSSITGEHGSNVCCARCNAQLASSHALDMSRREAELGMAITCMRHLNSPIFQKRFLPKVFESSNASPETTAEAEADPADSEPDPKEPADQSDEREVSVVASGDARSVGDGKEEDGEEKLAAEQPNGESATADAVDETGSDAISAYDRDDSVDSDDRGDGWAQNWDENAQNDFYAQSDTGIESYTRYELVNWHAHVRDAEKLYTPKERAESAAWQALVEEFRKFFITNARVFQAWKDEARESYQADWSPLHFAAQYGLVSLAELLIENGADVMHVTPRGNSSLHVASEAPNPLPILRLLLQKGGDPNLETEDTAIPAFHDWMMADPDADCVKELLDHGADCKLIGEVGWNVMHYVALYGTKPDVLELLLDNPKNENNRASLDVQDNRGQTPLHKVMARKPVPLQFLEAMIVRGASVDAEDEESEQPLFEAANYGELDAIKLIVDKVKDIDDPDSVGRTALQVAAWSGFKDIVEVLLEKGANPNKPDGHGRTPLFFACLGSYYRLKDAEAVAEFLLDKLVACGLHVEEINSVTKRGRSVLREAAAHGFTKIVEYILQNLDSSNKSALDHRDSLKGRNALHCAAKNGHSKIVGLLLKHGATTSLRDDVKEKADKGKTALELCVDKWEMVSTSEYEQTIIELIDHSPAEAAQYRPLLLTAAVNGSVPVLERLLHAKADLNEPDQYGWTPILLARQFQSQEAEDFLSTRVIQAGIRPSRWSSHWDAGIAAELSDYPVLADENCVVTHPGDRRICLLADRPIPAGLKKYYFELEILPDNDPESVDVDNPPENDSPRPVQEPTPPPEPVARSFVNEPYPIVAIGFTTTSDASALQFPGWINRAAPRALSWAYHGDDGGLFHRNSASENQEGWGHPGDVVGAGVDFDSGKIWFTRNGVKVSQNGFGGIRGRLFPVVGLKDAIKLRVRFDGEIGGKFRWQEGS